MILSKANLEIVRVTKDDKQQERLYTLHITESGSTVASNGRVILAVSPVLEQSKKQFPLKSEGDDRETSGEEMTIPAQFVKEILKNLPKDLLFKGALEHCRIESTDDDAVIVYVTDGKRTNSIKSRKHSQKYLSYGDVIGHAIAHSSSRTRAVLNLKRLLTLLQAIDKVCPDSTGETPVYLEFTKDNDVIVRGYNRKTGQDIVAVMTSYKDIEGKFHSNEKWESGLIGTNKRVRRIKTKKE